MHEFSGRLVLPLDYEVLIPSLVRNVARPLLRFKPVLVLERHVELLLQLHLLLLLYLLILKAVHELFTLLNHAAIVWSYDASTTDTDSNLLDELALRVLLHIGLEDD